MRTGLPSLDKVSREMCRLITKYQLVIRALYPENQALLAALAAALAACSALRSEIDEVIVPGD